MTRPLFLRLALVFATLACLACLPAAASAVEIRRGLRLQGHRHRHRSPAGAGQIGGIEYRIEGKFDTTGPLDLTMSTVTFHISSDEYLKDVSFRGRRLRATVTERWSSPLTTQTWSARSLPATVCLCWPRFVSPSSSKASRPSTRRRAGSARRCACRSRTRTGSTSSTCGSTAALSPQVLLPGADRPAASSPRIVSSRTFAASIRPTRATRPKTNIRTSFTIDDGTNEPVVLDFVEGLGVRSARPLPPPRALSRPPRLDNLGPLVVSGPRFVIRQLTPLDVRLGANDRSRVVGLGFARPTIRFARPWHTAVDGSIPGAHGDRRSPAAGS